MAKQTGLMGRKVRFSVVVATHIGDTTTKEYRTQTGTCVSGSWGRGYWSKQLVNVLADDGHIYELELRAITVVGKEPCQVPEKTGNDLARVRAKMAEQQQPPQGPQRDEENWDK